MTRRLNYGLLAFFIIIGIPYYWYLLASGPGGLPPKRVTMAQLRSLASAREGQAPTQVRVEVLGIRKVMRNKLVAGEGLRPVVTAVRSYQLAIPGQKPIVIDAGLTGAAARQQQVENFDRAAQRRVNRAVAQASHVVILRDTPLHNGGRKPGAGQSGEGEADESASDPYPLAPGVVIIPAPDLGDRAELVYVQLQNGREFLFAGAAAGIRASLTRQRPPARLVTRHGLPGYTAQIQSWLTTINALKRTAPDMAVVTAYDSADTGYATRRFSDHSIQD